MKMNKSFWIPFVLVLILVTIGIIYLDDAPPSDYYPLSKGGNALGAGFYLWQDENYVFLYDERDTSVFSTASVPPKGRETILSLTSYTIALDGSLVVQEMTVTVYRPRWHRGYSYKPQLASTAK